MRKIIFLMLSLFLISCSSSPETPPIHSIRFTPLDFPFSNLGEFTLSDTVHQEELDLFLKIFEESFQADNKIMTSQIEPLPHVFSLQLFSGNTLVDIYRLSFDPEKNIAFLQKEHDIYALKAESFHQIMATGYFNIIFHKNYAPTAEFYLNQEKIRVSTTGTWNYETYQKKFLSYKINIQQDSVHPVKLKDSKLHFHFGEKEPNQLILTIRSADSIYRNRIVIEDNELEIPSEENLYYYELEALWNDKNLPYQAALRYQFTLDINFPPQIKIEDTIMAGSVLPIQVEDFDKNGKLVVRSNLWNQEIPLVYHNPYYFALVPIPLQTAAGTYPLQIIGSQSNEYLKAEYQISVLEPSFRQHFLKGKRNPSLSNAMARQEYFVSFIDKVSRHSEYGKLWSEKFLKPVQTATIYDFGEVLKHQDTEYQSKAEVYLKNQDTEVLADTDGFVKKINQHPDWGYTLLLEHGMGVFSLYSGLDEITVSPGEFVPRGHSLGSLKKNTERSPFYYTNIVYGFFTNPDTFREHDFMQH